MTKIHIGYLAFVQFVRRKRLKSILPEWLYVVITQNYNLEDIQEIRVRKNKPIKICYKGKIIDLKTNSGLYLKPIIASSELIEYIISCSTKNSLYAFEEQIKSGFIVTENGLRIGLCGTAVVNNDKITFIKNISSLNIRIGHNIPDVSKTIFNYIASNHEVKNTLIISPPGAGKTTFLRDIIQKLSEFQDIPNIMVVDEKFELAGENQRFSLGNNVDVMQGSNKRFAFYDAIKVMNPSVIVTDELTGEDDIDGVRFAAWSGVGVIATAHAKNMEELKSKPYFEKLLKEKIFQRFVCLSKRNGVGTIEGVFDENSFALFLPYLS